MSEITATDEIWVYDPLEEQDTKLGQGFDNLKSVKIHLQNVYNFAGTDPLVIKRKTSSGSLEKIQPYRPV